MSLNYVAIGSSYAAGPDPQGLRSPCLRSDDNYPHRVAEARGMNLTDVTCTGATTANVIARPQKVWTNAVQISAVRPDTDLVTITVGGNDLDYVGRLTAMSCADIAPAAQTRAVKRECGRGHPLRAEPDSDSYTAVEQNLARIVLDARVRAPRAKVVVVDYPPVIGSDMRTCAKLPLTPSQVAETKRIFDGLVAATARAARATGAILVQPSKAGAGHGVCSPQPWLTGFDPPMPYHPTDLGKQAVAKLVLGAI